jgi:Protein of unknown function (DUF2585)
MHMLKIPSKKLLYALLALSIILIQVVVLYLFGQPWISTEGYIKFWEGVVNSVGNSQHITDWYTYSHIIHGFLFYGLLAYFFPRMPVAMRMLCAIGIESAWEIAENTPTVIEHYRQQALAAGYTGDSILNSVFDSLAMLVGFCAAYKFSWKYIVATAIIFELFTAYMIRDNLSLNVINLVYPFTAIAEWQTAI